MGYLTCILGLEFREYPGYCHNTLSKMLGRNSSSILSDVNIQLGLVCQPQPMELVEDEPIVVDLEKKRDENGGDAAAIPESPIASVVLTPVGREQLRQACHKSLDFWMNCAIADYAEWETTDGLFLPRVTDNGAVLIYSFKNVECMHGKVIVISMIGVCYRTISHSTAPSPRGDGRRPQANAGGTQCRLSSSVLHLC